MASAVFCCLFLHALAFPPVGAVSAVGSTSRSRGCLCPRPPKTSLLLAPPVLPAFYGIFAGTFLLTTWFARMLGCLLVAWCPLEILDWPPFLCYCLYRKAPPWLLWKILPLGLHCVDVYFEFYPETRDFLEFCFKTEDWILSKLHCTIVP
jgi:hypothetical protein